MDPVSVPRPVVDEKIHSVTEITQNIKRVISTSFGALWIEGELSGYKRHSSGHHYFTLKDSGACISCACWRGSASRLTFQPEDGMKVQAFGTIDVYEVRGQYQFNVNTMRPAGMGELQRAFELLKKKLQGEGLFDAARKRALPPFPNVIGLVTASTGAALQDLRTVAAKRWPAAQLVLCNVHVQGDGAAQEIAAAIESFNRRHNVDVLIIGRGGGSLEDLWAFNEEVVARAIFKSRIPVVSAVGHEVDFTISDFVADLRAPTPSAAMEMVLPDRRDVEAKVKVLLRRLQSKVTERLRFLRSRLMVASQHYALRQPINTVNMYGQRVDQAQTRLVSAFESTVAEQRNRLNRSRELLGMFRPEAIFQRGYAMVRDSKGAIVRDLLRRKSGEMVVITCARGSADAEIKRVFEEPAL
jgi:exodeoxyribonuclease VII large subunit